MKKLFTSILSLVLLFSMVGSVFAESVKVNYEYSSVLVQAVQLEEVFVGAVGLDGDFVVLDQQKAIDNGISSDKINEAKEKIKEYNKIIKDTLDITPYFTFEGDQILFDDIAAEKNGVSMELINTTKSDVDKVNGLANTLDTRASCEGTNKYEDRWYGYDTYFDSCNTTKIIGLLTVGAGLTTIAGAITAALLPPVGIAIAIAGGLIGAGAGILTYASANGCGVIVRFTLDKPIWSGSQCS
ncbi:hypothetical protein ACQKNX_02420 [Lysinibacillus sp. NPDC093712]|uniref:hypothetical protein n=1 Tax=Lysinibacillus sp. NPDC093712 TaxID=3390579 RepID=UPI003D067694